MNQVAMDEGALACQDGKLSSENPYRQGSDERFGWLLGWVSTKPRPANFADKWAGSLGVVLVMPDALAPSVAIEVDSAEPILMPELNAFEDKKGEPV